MSRGPRRIKTDLGRNKQKRISEPQAVPDYDKSPILFSLSRVVPGEFCFSQLADECKARFADAIFRRKEMTWADLKQGQRHGLGTEKVDRTAIRAPIPRFITEENETFLVLRYNGRRAMVGYRQKDIFYVLWFDSRFNLYDHG